MDKRELGIGHIVDRERVSRIPLVDDLLDRFDKNVLHRFVVLAFLLKLHNLRVRGQKFGVGLERSQAAVGVVRRERLLREYVYQRPRGQVQLVQRTQLKHKYVTVLANYTKVRWSRPDWLQRERVHAVANARHFLQEGHNFSTVTRPIACHSVCDAMGCHYKK